MLKFEICPKNQLLETHFEDFPFLLENTQILGDSKATKCRNNVDFDSRIVEILELSDFSGSKPNIIRFSLNLFLNSLMK